MKNILYILLIIFSFSSCSKYQKILKNSDNDYKFEMAKNYYKDKDYFRALPLFDELKLYFSGSEKAEEVYYYLAYTHYGLSEYLVASYHFKSFATTFPNSKKTEEMSYMYAYCFYLESPAYSLDASYTIKAIEELQYFIEKFPTSNRIDTCNTLIDNLRGKLEKKSFSIAKQYYNTENYKSAVVAFNNLINDYPDTDYSEEIYFLILKSNYQLAIKSIYSKQKERYKGTIASHNKFINKYPNSGRMDEANNIYTKTIKKLENFK
tara:strand:+ start:61 stop:852 length:792 start_codon:yes stop_codon:yes gene_type:complete